MTFTILSVCTGNVCRSPVAEQLIAQALQDVDVNVSSAGVSALVGRGAPEPARRFASAYGIDVSGHVAQQVNRDGVRRSDLILGMARDHRRHLVEMMPSAMRRTFTLREFARLAEAAEPHLRETLGAANVGTAEDGMRAAVDLAASLRGTIPPPDDVADFDVVDPYGQSDEVYRRSFSEIDPAAQKVSEYLLTAGSIASS